MILIVVVQIVVKRTKLVKMNERMSKKKSEVEKNETLKGKLG